MIPQLWTRHFDFPEWRLQHPNIVETLGIEETIRFYEAELQLFKNYQEEIINQMRNRQNSLAENILNTSNVISDILTPGSSGGTQRNYALTFSGDRSGATDSYATTTFNPDTYSLWNGFTLSFWFRPDEEMDQQATILGSKANSPEARFHVGFPGTAGKMEVGIGTGKVVGINNPMEVGNWYNIVLSYAGNDEAPGEKFTRLWINTDARMTSNNNIAWANQDEGMTMYFGGRNTDQTPGHKYTQGFACALDEVAIYNRFIDSDGTFANEVYNAGTSYNHLTNGQSGLVGYWKFNEGSGTTITDHSGKGNNGTFGAISGDTTAFPIWEEITTY
jgi:hypothetical protein